MGKVGNFFLAIAMWFKSVGISIGKWFKNWAVEVDGKQIIPVRMGKWFKNWVVADSDGTRVFGRMMRTEGAKSVSASVIAAVLGLVAAFVLMLLVEPSRSLEGFGTLLVGGFKDTREIGRMLFRATPILLTGLSVGFAFKTGLFNIGATGQYTVGLFMSLFCSFYISNHWLACLLFGMLGGMVWGFIPGIFKALFNVSEVITSIMTNYIGLYLVQMLIINTPNLYNQIYTTSTVLPPESAIPNWGMEAIFGPRSSVNGSILIAIFIAIVVHIILNKTTLGYELKACGMSKDAAKYAGVNQKNRIVLAMVIAGALAGIGGAMFLQSGTGDTYSVKGVMVTEGFTGIAVALLGVSNPIGIIFAAIFFGHLESGGLALQGVGYKPEIVDIIVGVIIYFCAFVLLFKGFIGKIFAQRLGAKANANATTEAVTADATLTDATPDMVQSDSTEEVEK